jgi:hypothetical protein
MTWPPPPAPSAYELFCAVARARAGDRRHLTRAEPSRWQRLKTQSTPARNAAPARPKWQGQCPGCGQWNTLVETVIETDGCRLRAATATPAWPVAATGVQDARRHPAARGAAAGRTGIEEFDRVLGGGLVAGGVVLIGGDPGIGKSTLLLQALSRLAQAGAAGALRFRRGIRPSRWRCARAACSSKPSGLQPAGRRSVWRKFSPRSGQAEKPAGGGDRFDPDRCIPRRMQSAPGSVAQVRECAAQLTRLRQAKRHLRHSRRPCDQGGQRWPGRECWNTSSTPYSISRATRIRASG